MNMLVSRLWRRGQCELLNLQRCFSFELHRIIGSLTEIAPYRCDIFGIIRPNDSIDESLKIDEKYPEREHADTGVAHSK